MGGGALSNLLFRVLYILFISFSFLFRGLIKRLHSTKECSFFKPIPGVEVIIIPCLKDNYSYIVYDSYNKVAAAVDPVDVDAVLSHVNRLNLDLQYVLCTHHHWDHSGGNHEISWRTLKKNYSNQESSKIVHIVGSNIDKFRIPAITTAVGHEQKLTLGNLTITCLLTPCHTKGHLIFLVENDDRKPGVLFTGDTLFLGGCGKFFEGDAYDMYQSLELIKNLDESVLIFCGHEYTVSNLEFAKLIDPHNVTLNLKLKWAREQVQLRKPTVPSSLKEEKLYNPFLRCDQESIITAACIGQADLSVKTIETLGKIRRMKDNWKKPVSE